MESPGAQDRLAFDDFKGYFGWFLASAGVMKLIEVATKLFTNVWTETEFIQG
jgi:hypothetical protein